MKHRRSSPVAPRRGQAPRSASRSAPRGPAAAARVKIDLYGQHAVAAAILNPARRISALYAADGAGDTILDVLATAKRRGLARPALTLLPKPGFDAALGADCVHQGVGATADPLPETDLDELIRAAENHPGRRVFVMLDQVSDPHNLGAIIRSACAFGAVGLVAQRRHTPEPNGLVAKIACGGLEHLPLAFETNLSRSIEVLKEAGYTVFGFDERGDVDLPEVRVPDKAVLVMGAEGPGMRRLVREGCDQLIRLPTQEPIASLNVSNAAAVALYHFACMTFPSP